MVTALDDGVGQVLQTLQTQNLLNKTLIFFLSDNENVKFATRLCEFFAIDQSEDFLIWNLQKN